MSIDHLNAIMSLATGQSTIPLTLMHPTSMWCSSDLPCLNSLFDPPSLYGISYCSKVSNRRVHALSYIMGNQGKLKQHGRHGL